MRPTKEVKSSKVFFRNGKGFLRLEAVCPLAEVARVSARDSQRSLQVVRRPGVIAATTPSCKTTREGA